VVDKSGSMASDFKYVQSACEYISKAGWNPMRDRLIAYDTKTNEQSIESVATTRAGGSTDFVKALEAIKKC